MDLHNFACAHIQTYVQRTHTHCGVVLNFIKQFTNAQIHREKYIQSCTYVHTQITHRHRRTPTYTHTRTHTSTHSHTHLGTSMVRRLLFLSHVSPLSFKLLLDFGSRGARVVLQILCSPVQFVWFEYACVYECMLAVVCFVFCVSVSMCVYAHAYALCLPRRNCACAEQVIG